MITAIQSEALHKVENLHSNMIRAYVDRGQQPGSIALYRTDYDALLKLAPDRLTPALEVREGQLYYKGVLLKRARL